LKAPVTTVVVMTRTAMTLWEDQTPVVTATTRGTVSRMRHRHPPSMDYVETRAGKTATAKASWEDQTPVIFASTLSAPKPGQYVIQTNHVPMIMTATRTILACATWGIMEPDHTAVNGQDTNKPPVKYISRNNVVFIIKGGEHRYRHVCQF
jgi:hypothetical protein